MRFAPALVVLAACRFGFVSTAVEVDPDASIDAPDAIPEVDAFVEPNKVFVTSSVIAPTMLGSRAVADAHCQAAAESAGVAGTYVAWVSTTAEPARARLGNARGWVRMDGKPVIDDMATTLTTGRIWYPVTFDETGNLAASVHTGTKTDGTAGFNCDDWTNTAGNTTYASAGGGTEAWTAMFGQIALCNSSTGLLCFGVDRVARVAPPTDPGRTAFISSTPWIPSNGRANADALCAADASAAGLSGNYMALLPTSSSSAISRFTTTTPWARVDGVAIGSDLNQIAAPVNVTAMGQYVDDILNWSGATSITATPVATDNCMDWSTTTGSSWVGRASRSGGSLYGGGTASCGNTTNRVWCLAE